MTSDHSHTVCMLLRVIAHQKLLKGVAGIGHNLRGQAAVNLSEAVEQPITTQRGEKKLTSFLVIKKGSASGSYLSLVGSWLLPQRWFVRAINIRRCCMILP